MDEQLLDRALALGLHLRWVGCDGDHKYGRNCAQLGHPEGGVDRSEGAVLLALAWLGVAVMPSITHGVFYAATTSGGATDPNPVNAMLQAFIAGKEGIRDLKSSSAGTGERR